MRAIVGIDAQRGPSGLGFFTVCHMLARVDQWQRLGSSVRRDRHRAGLRRQAELANRAGVSPSTISKIERGVPGNYNAYTRAAIEGALGWSHGAFDRLLAGATDPVEIDEVRERLDAIWPKLSAPARRSLLAAAEAYLQQ